MLSSRFQGTYSISKILGTSHYDYIDHHESPKKPSCNRMVRTICSLCLPVITINRIMRTVPVVPLSLKRRKLIFFTGKLFDL